MCGFAGFLGGLPATLADRAALLADMANQIRHRGPDHGDTWCDPDQPFGLAHRRLAIVDLSAAGHQPMTAASGRHVIAFNGEIYNHLDIRAELERAGVAPRWRGHSDTETLLAGIDAWGAEATVRRAVGMFAFALWDRRTCTLTLRATGSAKSRSTTAGRQPAGAVPSCSGRNSRRCARTRRSRAASTATRCACICATTM